MPKWPLKVPATWIGLCVVAALAWLWLRPGHTDGLPEFDLAVLGDETARVSRNALIGEAQIVHFWASWCLSCRQEHPVWATLKQERTIRLVGVNHLDDASDAMAWLDFYGNIYDLVVADSEGIIGEALGLAGLPATVIVDRSGRVVFRHLGPVDEQLATQQLIPIYLQVRNGEHGNG